MYRRVVVISIHPRPLCWPLTLSLFFSTQPVTADDYLPGGGISLRFLPPKSVLLPISPRLLLLVGEYFLTYCFSVWHSQVIGRLSGRWTNGLVWYCSSAVMVQRIRALQHTHTHYNTHPDGLPSVCILASFKRNLSSSFFSWQRNLSSQHSCLFADFPCSCPN